MGKRVTDDVSEEAEPATVDALDADSNASVYRTSYDPATDDSLVTVLADAIATMTGYEPLEVEPLYTWVDLDALEALFARRSTGERRRGTVSFTVYEHTVTIVDGESISVEAP